MSRSDWRFMVPFIALAACDGVDDETQDICATDGSCGSSGDRPDLDEAPIPMTGPSGAPHPLEKAESPAVQATTASAIKQIFVIVMENHSASQVYGSSRAPYINNILIKNYARATAYYDTLPDLPSEPHYIWMEAGTNAFSDRTFTTNSDPSKTNSTASTAHLATQIKNAINGVTWMSYQEGINATTGACPIAKSGFYVPKHNPFVFFKDVAGTTPSKTNLYCGAHHGDFAAFAKDLQANAVRTYNFITPDLCHGMHGATGCPDSNTVRSGDTWLSQFLPPLISHVNANAGVIFIVWDEPGSPGGPMPFLVIGPGVKAGYASNTPYSHSSLVKSLEQIMELPVLPTVTSANTLSDFFMPGSYP